VEDKCCPPGNSINYCFSIFRREQEVFILGYHFLQVCNFVRFIRNGITIAETQFTLTVRYDKKYDLRTIGFGMLKAHS
jgi:hypothetical protein